MNKAKAEARQTISIVESQLKFLDKAECLHNKKNLTRKHIKCTPEMDRTTLARIAEKELIYIQNLPAKENSIEVKKFLFSSVRIFSYRFYIDR